MPVELTIPLKTKAEINGIPVEFTTDACVELPGVETLDHAAELLAGAKLDIDLSHKEGDKIVRYGAAGKRFESAVEKPEPKPKKATKPDTEKPDTVKKEAAPKAETKKGTKAKPKG